MTNKSYYYDVTEDIKNYPGAWCIVVIGGRNTGKTYSSLKSCVLDKRKFVFLKRTIKDVDLLCAGSGKPGAKASEFGIDLSPFKSVNRDLVTDVRAHLIKEGLGGFWNHINGESEGAPIGYLLALSAVSKYKGFDLSECDWLIFDEFIPQPWERVQHKEGEQLLDLYKTIARDREHRGRGALKLLCFANATSISNPTMNILEVTDIVADMQVRDIESVYLEDRGILIHKLHNNEEFDRVEQDTMLYKAMGNTAWGQMAFGNSFAYNDFTSVGKVSLKGYKPMLSLQYKNDIFYIYMKEGQYYMCKSKHQGEEMYNLNRENDQKLFFNERLYELRLACIEGKMKFETYSMYDIIVNFKKYFNI